MALELSKKAQQQINQSIKALTFVAKLKKKRHSSPDIAAIVQTTPPTPSVAGMEPAVSQITYNSPTIPGLPADSAPAERAVALLHQALSLLAANGVAGLPGVPNNASSRVEIVDSSGDGRADTVAVDTVGDGVVDTVIPLAHSGSSQDISALVDTTGDGIPDTLAVDTTGDGRADKMIPMAPATLPAALQRTRAEAAFNEKVKLASMTLPPPASPVLGSSPAGSPVIDSSNETEALVVEGLSPASRRVRVMPAKREAGVLARLDPSYKSSSADMDEDKVSKSRHTSKEIEDIASKSRHSSKEIVSPSAVPNPQQLAWLLRQEALPSSRASSRAQSQELPAQAVIAPLLVLSAPAPASPPRPPPRRSPSPAGSGSGQKVTRKASFPIDSPNTNVSTTEQGGPPVATLDIEGGSGNPGLLMRKVTSRNLLSELHDLHEREGASPTGLRGGQGDFDDMKV